MFKRIFQAAAEKLWYSDTAKMGRIEYFLVFSVRLLFVSVREFSSGQLSLRAASLAFMTLLSFVPFLAVSFSVLKAFGVHNQILPFLHEFLAPLGPKEPEITQNLISYIDNINAGVLGSIGLVTLIYTAVSVVQKIEESFSYIWKIKSRRSPQRIFTDYTSALLVGPVLVVSALGITASIMNAGIVREIVSIEPFGTVIYTAGKAVPYIFVCAAFTFAYFFIPNTKIKLKSALAGGIAGGVLWETSGWAFAAFTVSSKQYSLIYSGFAIVILFMMWINLSWIALLGGAEISYYHQHPQMVSLKKEKPAIVSSSGEMIALYIMFLLGSSYFFNKPQWTLPSLLNRLKLPPDHVQDVIQALKEKNLVVQTCHEPPSYLPARELETIKLLDILQSVRGNDRARLPVEDTCGAEPAIERVFRNVDSALENALGHETLRSLVVSCAEAENAKDKPQKH